MPRVTDAEVKALVNTSLDTTPFIATASVLVTTVLAPYYSDAQLLATMELWWAGHLVCAKEPLVVEKALGETRVRYQRPKEGTGLSSTFYGSVLLDLDTLGVLATTSDGGSAGASFASWESY